MQIWLHAYTTTSVSCLTRLNQKMWVFSFWGKCRVVVRKWMDQLVFIVQFRLDPEKKVQPCFDNRLRLKALKIISLLNNLNNIEGFYSFIKL